MFLIFVTMATKQWNRKKLIKNDILKPNYRLTAQVYMNYANSAVITSTWFSNKKNKIIQNISNFVTMPNKQHTGQPLRRFAVFYADFMETKNGGDQ